MQPIDAIISLSATRLHGMVHLPTIGSDSKTCHSGMLIIIIDNLLLRDVHLVDDELLSPPAEHAAKEFSEAMLGAQLPAHE